MHFVNLSCLFINESINYVRNFTLEALPGITSVGYIDSDVYLLQSEAAERSLNSVAFVCMTALYLNETLLSKTLYKTLPPDSNFVLVSIQFIIGFSGLIDVPAGEGVSGSGGVCDVMISHGSDIIMLVASCGMLWVLGSDCSWTTSRTSSHHHDALGGWDFPIGHWPASA